MEKCTFCVQRIREAENRARRSRSATCSPTSSRRRARRPVRRARSSFGDAADPNWAVAQLVAGRARVPRVRGAQHLHGGGLPEEGEPSGGRRAARRRRTGGATWRRSLQPLPGATSRAPEHSRRPTFSFPAVKDYEQVDREIAAHAPARRSAGSSALGVAILCLLIGIAALDLPDLLGPRRRRVQPAGDVGRLHHHLRVLGRYRSRRHADLGDSVSLPRRLPHDASTGAPKR